MKPLVHAVNRSVVAEGPLKTLTIFLVIFLVVIAGITYSEPFASEYEVKTAARMGCNELINQTRYGRPTGWEDIFIRRSNMAGVHLKKDQYDFKVEPQYDRFICKAAIAWRSQTEIFLLSQAFDIQPMKIVHRIDFEHEIRKSY